MIARLSEEANRQQYDGFMRDLVELVVDKYNGHLQLLYCDVAVRTVNPHASGAGNPRRHIAFLPERRCDAEADILRHGTPPTCLLSSAGEHRGLPVRAAYGVRRRSGVTSGAVEQA
jgi:hypothetical protein